MTRRIDFFHSSYADLPANLERLSTPPPQAILVDLGVSSLHVDEARRGFSFSKDGPLDMRFNPSEGESAAQLLERLSVEELTTILRDFGEEPFAPKVARAIKEALPLATTKALAEVVAKAIPKKVWAPKKTDPATKTFQAIRIAVNDELGHLRRFLQDAPGLLAKGGRLGVISFHSLEDRMVKEHFRSLCDPCICPKDFPVCRCERKASFVAVTKKACVASEDEAKRNPRSRSARFRVVEKIS